MPPHSDCHPGQATALHPDRHPGQASVSERDPGPIAPLGAQPIHRSRLALPTVARSEEHTSELQSLMRISYAVFCLKKKKKNLQKSSTDKLICISIISFYIVSHNHH